MYTIVPLFSMVLQFHVGETHEGSANLFLDLFAAYEAHEGLISGRSFYTDTDKSIDMLNLNSWAPRSEASTTILAQLFSKKKVEVLSSLWCRRRRRSRSSSSSLLSLWRNFNLGFYFKCWSKSYNFSQSLGLRPDQCPKHCKAFLTKWCPIYIY